MSVTLIFRKCGELVVLLLEKGLVVRGFLVARDCDKRPTDDSKILKFIGHQSCESHAISEFRLSKFEKICAGIYIDNCVRRNTG